MHRRILHVDMDAFFASVEQHDDPALRGRPVIVAGSEKARGVVCAASYEARPFGVRSAMPTSRALRLCPEAIRIPPRHGRYREVSREIHAVFASFTEQIEPLSLDESYLDVTERCVRDRMPLAVLAAEVKRAVKARTGLTASAGGGPNKFVAKIASDLRKPDGLLIVAPGEVASFLRPLPVDRIWGVGPVTAARLRAIGLQTMGDIVDRGAEWMEARLGRGGSGLHALALGRDDRPVVAHHEPRSISSETTFAVDVSDLEELRDVLREQAEEVGERLARNGYEAKTVVLKVRYDDFTTITRSLSPPIRVAGPGDLLPQVDVLLARTEAGRRPVRLVGVGVGGLVPDDLPMQLELPFLDP
jgi:DNA polymerase-4